MAIFQKSVLNKFIKSQDSSKIDIAYQKFSEIFLQAERQAEIRSMKEEEYQDGFLDDLFVNVLGYVKRPNTGYNLVREKKNEADSKKADGAILKNDLPLAVIELKGTDTTDLDKVTEQGFGYKNNHKECVYVVTSNFEKLRFFIHNAVEFIEFNLFTLSKEDFITLWLCLHSDNLLDNIPAKIKSESVVKEEDITKNLYKDYSSFKQELWQNIVALNPNGDPLMFYKKTQKLIDRFLFIFFAEDAGLLPPNSISRMVERWKMLKDEDAYKPLYDIFKQYFGYINTGRPGKTPQDEIFAYNGGLMLEDDVLESISIDDDILLKHVSKLTSYDFSSEVDVNILGHIFENSLNDIEAVTAELEGQEIDKSKTKRKKDGVFYTPKYITKYIVENTVGKLCQEKKIELNIIDEEYAKGRTHHKKEYLKKLDQNLQDYRNWLLQITICDPACGSGAFLNQALEFLMEEHQYIDELESKLLGSGFKFPGVENHILENNIFGVDINEESVEIAKLSLWLRTAQRGRKLTSLNNNIKCGNSLIDDPEVAGEKAFNWQSEFVSVFEKGGFDVVIGNPPYVQLSKLSTTSVSEKKYLIERFSTSGGRLNTYIFFIHLIEILLKKDGLSSYIIPNTILTQEYYSETRKLILSKLNLYQIINYPVMPFSDAVVDSVTLFMCNTNSIDEIEIFSQEPHLTVLNRKIKKETFEKNYNYNFEVNGDQVTSKIESLNLNKLGDFLEINQAIALKGDKSLSVKTTHNDGLLKLIDGKHINRFIINWGGEYLDYDVDKIHSCKRRDIFESSEKLFFRRVSSTLVFAYDNEQFFALNTLIVLNSNPNCPYSLKSLLGLLNSKLMNHFYVNKYKSTKKVFSEIQASTVKLLPIAKITNESELIVKVDLILKLKKDLFQISSKLIDMLKSDFQIESISKKIENFYQSTWSEFEKELNKCKVTIKGVQKDDWFDRFIRFQKQAIELNSQIEKTEIEIDQFVYQLYKLTDEEIQIVENS